MRRLVLIVLSAGLAVEIFPPWDVRALAWLALVPFLIALRGLPPLRASLLGLAWGTLV